MNYQQVIKYFGSQIAAAKALGITQPTVSMWRARGRVPALQQLRIEQLTEGRLKASKSILCGKVSRE